MSLPPSDDNKHGEPSTTAGDKRILRRSLLKLRSDIHPDVRKYFDQKISEQVSKYLKSFTFPTLGVYLPIRNEPELDILYTGLSTKMALSLPITSGKEQPLQFVRWSPGDELIVGDYGIAVPKELKPVPMPAAMLIPCVGFTKNRFRLGYGGGFFDRTLALYPQTHKIGVAYSCLATAFDAEENDIPLDCVITEQGIVL